MLLSKRGCHPVPRAKWRSATRNAMSHVALHHCMRRSRRRGVLLPVVVHPTHAVALVREDRIVERLPAAVLAIILARRPERWLEVVGDTVASGAKRQRVNRGGQLWVAAALV